ncbi:MAG TPA: ADOP family duplicated permease [Gemmatimonadaceae bacterium]|jgi:predicted permease
MLDWRQEIHARLASLRLDAATEADIAEEMAQHIEDELREIPPYVEDRDARVRAILDGFDIAALRETMRVRASQRAAAAPPPVGSRAIGRNVIDLVRRDVVYGWRSLWRTKAATTAIILSLAIVIGANTAIFGLVDAMFLRRLPLPKAEQLVAVTPVENGRAVSVSYEMYKQLKDATALPIEGLRTEGVSVVPMTTPAGDQTNLWADLVTGGYFNLLGVKPLVGRMLNKQDEQAALPVAVISEEFWTTHLGHRPNVLGTQLRIDDMTVTVVGVAASGFTGVYFAHHFQVALPFTISPEGITNFSRLSLTLIGRAVTGNTRTGLTASIDGAYRACCLDASDNSRLHPQGSSVGLHLVTVDDPPLAWAESHYETGVPGIHVLLNDASRGLPWDVDYRDRYRSVLLATMAAVLLLLAIACANVATLLLARGETREREFAVRRSLGASAGRVRLQLLIEGLEVVAVGGALGFALAAMGTKLLLHALPLSAAPLGNSIAWRSSGVMIAFTSAIILICAIATGLLPAQRAGREQLLGSLTGSRRHAVPMWRADRVLVVTQLTLAIVLTTAAALYVSTVHNLTRDDGGYRTRQVLLVRLQARDRDLDRSALRSDYESVLRDANTVPGVERAALTFDAPVLQDGEMPTRVNPPDGIGEQQPTRINPVSDGFLSAAGVGLVAGRDFTASDDEHNAPVVIVSQAFARHFFGRGSPIDRTIYVGYKSDVKPLLIIGVAHDAGYDKMVGLGTNLRTLESEILYEPIAQDKYLPSTMSMIVRTTGDPLGVAPSIRRLVLAHASLDIYSVTSLGQLLDDSASRERFAAALATGFGFIALILTAIGVFGVLWFNVSQRTKEIGVRMALGAQRSDAVRLVLRQSFIMTAIAVAIGIPLAIGCAWTVRAQFFGVGPTNFPTLLGSSLLLAAIAMIASLIPCQHAARVDPLVALREDGV